MNRKFKHTEIGKIPEDWAIKNLTQVADIFLGGTPATSIEEYWNGNIKWASAKDVTQCKSRFVNITERTITEKGVKNSATKVMQRGTIVITARGTVGELAILPESMSFNQTCYGLRAKAIDGMFLYYRLKSAVDYLKRISYGTVFNTITMKTLDDLKISFPKQLKEQRAIAKILSDLDEKIELNRQMNKTLESIAQAIFKHWFVDFEFPNKQGKPYKLSGGKMVDSELGDIPKDWDVNKVKNFGAVVCGKTPPKSVKKYFGGDIPFIKIPDMHNQLFIIKTEDPLSRKGKFHQQNKTIPNKSICVSCIATVGLVALTSMESQTNQQINSIIPADQNSTYFLYCVFKRMRRYLEDLGSGGSATLNINTTSFSNIRINKPEKDILRKFDEVVEPLFEKILNNLIGIEKLRITRDSLVLKLMTGRIRVNEKKV